MRSALFQMLAFIVPLAFSLVFFEEQPSARAETGPPAPRVTVANPIAKTIDVSG